MHASHMRLFMAGVLLCSGAAVMPAADAVEQVPDMKRAVAAALKALEARPPGNQTPSVLAIPNPDPFAAAATPALAATSIGVGYTTPEKVPCFNCVVGGGSSVATPIPLGVISSGSVVAYTLQWQSVSYNGPCTPAYAVVLLPDTVLDTATHSFPNCQSSFLYVVAWHGTIFPSGSGPAVLVGVIAGGTNKSVVYQPITIR